MTTKLPGTGEEGHGAFGKDHSGITLVHRPEPTVEEELYKHFGMDGVDGTYWHVLTRVKEARQVGTLTIDDFQEIGEEEISELAAYVRSREDRARREKMEKQYLSCFAYEDWETGEDSVLRIGDRIGLNHQEPSTGFEDVLIGKIITHHANGLPIVLVGSDEEGDYLCLQELFMNGWTFIRLDAAVERLSTNEPE